MLVSLRNSENEEQWAFKCLEYGWTDYHTLGKNIQSSIKRSKTYLNLFKTGEIIRHADLNEHLYYDGFVINTEKTRLSGGTKLIL